MNEEELAAQAAAEAAQAEADRAAAQLAEAEKAAKEKTDGKPTDAEAKLIKEIMKLKAEKKAEADKAKSLSEQLSGIDLDAAKEALRKMEEAETAELERKGEYQRLLEKQREAAETDKAAIMKQLEDIQKERESLAKAVDELTLGNAFANSKFIQEKLALTPSKTRALYASHFEIKDGQLVAYDKPAGSTNRTTIINASGDPVAFEAAIEAIINADPDKDYLIKSEQKPGAGSKGTNIDSSLKQRDNNKSSLDKIAEGLTNNKNFGNQKLS